MKRTCSCMQAFKLIIYNNLYSLLSRYIAYSDESVYGNGGEGEEVEAL